MSVNFFRVVSTSYQKVSRFVQENIGLVEHTGVGDGRVRQGLEESHTDSGPS